MRNGELTRRESAIVSGARSPRSVQHFLDGLPYSYDKSLRTFRGVMRTGQVHCLEGALCAATILEAHGYPPLLLDLRSIDGLDHVVFLFEHRGRFGTVGRSRDPGLHGRKPVFGSIEELVRSYVLPFIDFTGRLRGWATYDLRRLRRCDWRLSERNVWAVERALLENRGHRLRTSDDEYKRWHRRYVRFRSEHEDRKPLYYPDRDRWLSSGPRA